VRRLEEWVRRRRRLVGIAWIALLAGGYGLGGVAGGVLILAAWPLFLLLMITLPRQPFLSRDRKPPPR
jgi:hypothetical protein